MTGTRMAAEMLEQPARLAELIARYDEIAGQVRAVAPPSLTGVTIVARGSSDHAAVYGRYLLEVALRKPVSLAAPSLHTIYRADVDYRGQLVIAVSQSGAGGGLTPRGLLEGAGTIVFGDMRELPGLLAAMAAREARRHLSSHGEVGICDI